LSIRGYGFLKNSKKKLKFQKFKKGIKVAIFHLPQSEHESFWQYLPRLNNYLAQYGISCMKNWKYAMLCLRR